MSCKTTALIFIALHVAAGGPLIGEIVNDILSQPINRAFDSPLQPGAFGDLPADDQTKRPIMPRATDSLLGLPKIPRPPLPPPIIPKLPRPRPLTPLEVNRGFGRALSLITILGQVDSYIAERARAVVRKLLLLVDDDSPNRIQQTTSTKMIRKWTWDVLTLNSVSAAESCPTFCINTMKCSSLLFLLHYNILPPNVFIHDNPTQVLYKAVLICGETALKTPDLIDIENTSKENGKNMERPQRSPSPFDSIPKLPFSASSFPGREQPPLYPYDQEGHSTQYLPNQYTNGPRPFHYQELPSPSQIDLVPQPLLNDEKHFIHYTMKQSSFAGVNHDQKDYSSSISFNMEPETQLESSVSPQKQENLFMSDDALPPTLHQSPHDVFPCAEQTFHTKEAPGHHDVYHHEEQFFHGEEPVARSEKRLYYPEPSLVVHPDEQVHHQDSFVHQELYPEAPELSITFGRFLGSAPKKNLHNSNGDNRKEIKVNDGKKVERIIDDCSGTEKRIYLRPPEIFLVNVDDKCSNGGSSVNDQRQGQGCPGEPHSEENCGKITSQSVKCKPQVCSGKIETMNRNTCNDGFVQNEGTKVISRGNSNKTPFDIRNVMSKEQFNELRALLQNIARNHGSKPRGFTEDFKDTQPPKSNTSTEDFSCSCKCLSKLCKCLHLAKDVGYFIVENSRLALRGLRGSTTVDCKNCDIHDHFLCEGRHPSFEK